MSLKNSGISDDSHPCVVSRGSKDDNLWAWTDKWKQLLAYFSPRIYRVHLRAKISPRPFRKHDKINNVTFRVSFSWANYVFRTKQKNLGRRLDTIFGLTLYNFRFPWQQQLKLNPGCQNKMIKILLFTSYFQSAELWPGTTFSFFLTECRADVQVSC